MERHLLQEKKYLDFVAVVIDSGDVLGNPTCFSFVFSLVCPWKVSHCGYLVRTLHLSPLSLQELGHATTKHEYTKWRGRAK